jgi:hypothetical protein
MHRRPLGAGRRLAALASIIIIAACFLPWSRSSADFGLTPLEYNAFKSAGVIVFFVALAIIALLALPYAAGDVPVGLDRPLSFVIVTVVGWLGIAIHTIGVATQNLEALFPQRAYGLWLAVLGMILLSRAVYNVTRERRA